MDPSIFVIIALKHQTAPVVAPAPAAALELPAPLPGIIPGNAVLADFAAWTRKMLTRIQ
jgi:hypothetical protein